MKAPRLKGHANIEFTGTGCGTCECGGVSPTQLPTLMARREWHREHRREVAVERPAPTIRALRDDEPIPDGEPRRYLTSGGYVRLRWRVGIGEYVEVSEHRYVMGRPSGMHVHHVDHDKTNNDPSNLVILSAEEHSKLHWAESERRAETEREAPPEEPSPHPRSTSEEKWREVAAVYLSGVPTTELSRRYGMHSSTISRNLRRLGVEMAAPAGPGSWTRRPITHCAKGHEFTPENTIFTDRQRRCRKCREDYESTAHARELSRARVARYHERRRQAS